TLYKTGNGMLYVAALGALFEGRKHGSRYRFSQRPILKIDDVIRMQGDSLGRVWISNAQGIICFDPKQNIAIGFNETNGFDHTYAIQPWYREYQSTSGVMVISDPTGISLFNPLSLTIDTARTFPVLTGLKINNHDYVVETKARAGGFSTNQAINALKELVLDYQDNNFAIEFSAMEMISPDKNRYRYKLEGYDDEWIETDSKTRIATYTNMDAGVFVFKVRASNHHGIWSDQEKTLVIRILPPPWKTWWAYTLYGLAFVSILFVWRKYDIKRVKLKNRAEHLTELDNLKTRFFANISHEFRTPITLILGPLKEMYQGKFKGDQTSTMGIMLRNGQRLLGLINQLLDLSKIEAGKLKLHASPTDLVEFLREIVSSYESLAADKKIKYFFYPEVEILIAYIDAEKMEKVIHNVLSNAFKFTKPGGEIILYLKIDKNQCVITVKDTGIGIPTEQLNKVFDRFYQVDSSQTRAYEGSGLGMALAKELVELHKGKISVSSAEGKGTTFTVTIPLGKEHLNKDEISDSAYHLEAEKLSDIVLSAGIDSDVKEDESAALQPMLLIVEDNADMRRYIRKTLAEHYHIIEAENGKAGVKLAEETIPDLIISDIMMPEMDGYKLCELIKTNELTSHIPVILLTAKADRESKLTGLEYGADDYLSKPFDADELKLIVRNRIEERRRMRERFSKEITLEPKQISITSLDEKFLSKVLAIIEEHMEDEHFSIEELSREAGFSNMHFYRKIKGLSGQTPSQFLRTIRLKRAAELLAKNSDNVTQIAYSVGFSSLSYFNKCFKEQFGVTPGKFQT
ncbi:MAG: hybrid sensor histidine kinase/response regulator transcription factor, partial [Cyclobacteriaceae bacterium]